MGFIKVFLSLLIAEYPNYGLSWTDNFDVKGHHPFTFSSTPDEFSIRTEPLGIDLIGVASDLTQDLGVNSHQKLWVTLDSDSKLVVITIYW